MAEIRLVLCVVALTKFVAAAVLLKSWALLLWLNSDAMFGIFAGVLLLVGVLFFVVGFLAELIVNQNERIDELERRLKDH